MTDGNLTALVLLLYLLFALTIVYIIGVFLERARERKKQASDITYDTTKPSDNHSGNFVSSETKGWHPEEKRHHQEERFYWKISAIISLLIGFGALTSTAFTYLALRASWDALAETRKATVEAHKQATAALDQTRPWLIPEFKIINLTIDESGIVNFEISVRTKNIGNYPAIISFVAPTLTISDFATDISESQKLCDDDLKSWKNIIKAGGPFIAPNDTTPWRYQFGVMANRKKQESIPKNKTVSLVFSVCVSYASDRAAQIYQLGELYRVATGTQNNYPKSLIVGATRPLRITEGIFLIQEQYGNFARTVDISE